MSKESVTKSPCINVCVLNEDDVCEGCYRSADEITHWSEMNDEQRRGVLEKVDKRFHELNSHLLL